MKHQALFLRKIIVKKKISVVCCKFLFGALRVKIEGLHFRKLMICIILRQILFLQYIIHCGPSSLEFI